MGIAKKLPAAAAIAAALALGWAAPAYAAPKVDYAELRSIYRELIETNTTLSAGSCTAAAEKVAERLAAAGLPDAAITRFSVPDHPRDGGLVAVWEGSDKAKKPMLLLAHLDVVEAHREDWTRDPFTLVEENGYFYARGAEDDKAQAAIWTETMVRLIRAKQRLPRTIKLALTCGEETSGAFNGAEWLAKNRRALIDAEYALNEGGGGETNGTPIAKGGKLVVQTLQVGEKAYQDFTLTVTNPGGHSSQPVPDNAINRLALALSRIAAYEFPVELSDTTRAYFRGSAKLKGGAEGAAMTALLADPADKAALAVLDRNKLYHSLLRTTCVATLVDAGHALNALPQRASANVNCRMFPGRTAQETMAALTAAIGDDSVAIEPRIKDKPIAQPPPLDPRILGPVEALAKKHFPGVPVVPAMSTGATDGVYLEAVGIPVYGVPGIWDDPDGNGTHGLNERLEVLSLTRGRDYLYDLVLALAR